MVVAAVVGAAVVAVAVVVVAVVVTVVASVVVAVVVAAEDGILLDVAEGGAGRQAQQQRQRKNANTFHSKSLLCKMGIYIYTIIITKEGDLVNW